MVLCEVVVLFLHVCLSNAFDSYSVPEPKIEVFNPAGFRISIEDSNDVTFVAFHINMNRHLQHQQLGEFSKEIFHPLNGRWRYTVPNVPLKVGDSLHYWLFVIKEKMGYRKQGTYFLEDLAKGSFVPSGPHPSQPPPNQGQPQPEYCKTCTDDRSEALPTTSAPESSTKSHLNICEHFLLNATQNLLGLQSQLETLRKTNQQLTDFLQKYPDAKQLTLTGRTSLNDEPSMTVRFIIREKLELNPDVVSAVRKSDDSIEFTVATVTEKLEILEVAKEKLSNSRFSIS